MAQRWSPAATTRAFRSRGQWLALAVSAAWCLFVAPVAVASDGDQERILDRPIVDVAVIERGGAPWPDLLTLGASGAADGALRVTLLRRDVDWVIVGEATVTLDGTPDWPSWLVDLGDGRLAIVAILNQGSSLVVPLHVDPTSRPTPLQDGAAVAIDGMVGGTGATDVDGDGAGDLVVTGESGPGSCELGSRIEVLSGDDLGRRDAVALPGLSLAGAALGEWDGRPGADLLVSAQECNNSFFPDGRPHLLGIRLRDGSTIVDIPAAETDATDLLPSPPLVVDVDGDGRDEAIVQSDTTISIVDPMNAWQSTIVAVGNVAPLVATRWPVGPPSATVSWLRLRTGFEPGQFGFESARITRVDGVLSAGPATDRAVPGARPVELDILARLEDPGFSQEPPLAWSADLDGDGCPEILAPLVRAGCLGTGEVGLGPLWMATRPLAVVGPAADRRLLAALGLDWSTPAVADADAPGAWRNGSSVSFTLAELPVPWGPSEPVVPVVAPVVDPFADADGLIDLSGPTGTRLLVRARGLATDLIPSPEPVSTRSDFLGLAPNEPEFIGSVRIPVPPGTTPGETLGSVPFDLRAVWTPAIGPPYMWRVAVATLDAWGNVSDPVAVTAIHDLTAPTVEVAVPFLSAPWPFEAGIAGTSEAGVSVRLGDGPLVPVDDTDSFEVRTQLAPWPQTFEITAVDPSGNATVTRVSVMGGVDVRQLPWAVIGAVGVLVAVGLSSIRGGRRVRSTVFVTRTSDDEDRLPVIEELSSGPIGRRD